MQKWLQTLFSKGFVKILWDFCVVCLNLPVWNYVSSLRDGVKQTYSVVVKNGKVIRLPENNYNDIKRVIEKERKQLETNPVVIAEKERIEKEQKRVRSIPSGTPRSINLEWDAVPSGYVGDNDSFDEIFNKFQSLGIKDEYEKREDFISRTVSLVGDTIYAFSVKLNSAHYDAENQQWRIYLENMPSFSSSSSEKNIIISENLEHGGDYVGVNGFGLETDVFLEHLIVKLLECYPAIKPIAPFRASTRPTLTFDMEANNARFLGKQNIGVLLISKVKKSSPDSIASITKEEKKPTIDSKIHLFTTTYKLAVEMYQIWVYDKNTGKVLTKQFVHN